MALRIGEWLPGYGDDGDELRLACGDELVAEQFELRIEARGHHRPHEQHPANAGRRSRYSLRHLVNAGPAGITTLEQPAPRWSHYVFKLRKAGLVISTDRESHSIGGCGPILKPLLRAYPLHVM